MAQQERSTPPPEHTDRTGLRSALWLPIFDELADPTMVTRLAAEAEEAGWHGVFVWDHLRCGRRSGRWPTPGSRWQRSPPPPNTYGSAP
jgi:alkanesulfonate monooxygenase SsuD/methylene tetrahydromethanopterin reductase-like flavin-dependent oxidoreductase (luciferase family)